MQSFHSWRFCTTQIITVIIVCMHAYYVHVCTLGGGGRKQAQKEIHCKHKNLSFATKNFMYMSKILFCALWNNLR